MSFSSEQSSRQTTTTTLPRQDTATTVSSLSTSCSNLETGDSTSSSLKCTTANDNNHNRKNKGGKKRNRRRSYEHFVPACDAKTLKTLKIHYYPEEQNWSYVVALASAIVHAISHGLQFAFGIFLVVVVDKFGSTASSSLPLAGEERFIINSLS
jgi:hypothetical protein